VENMVLDSLIDWDFKLSLILFVLMNFNELFSFAFGYIYFSFIIYDSSSLDLKQIKFKVQFPISSLM
jgi:hypothetical protein